jgi:TM2 domain-containing membrane protein YozV
MRDPFIAGVLSLVIPGAGQIYNGRILSGVLWFLCAFFFWGWTGGLLGWIFHIIAAYCAYSYAKEHPVRI